MHKALRLCRGRHPPVPAVAHTTGLAVSDSKTEVTGNPQQVEGLEIHEQPDGCVVYQKSREKVHFLNHTAVFLLELCNGRHSMEEIREIYAATFDRSPAPDQEIAAIFEQFAAEELVRIP